MEGLIVNSNKQNNRNMKDQIPTTSQSVKYVTNNNTYQKRLISSLYPTETRNNELYNFCLTIFCTLTKLA